MNSQYVNRIIRACKLDVSLYEEVEADKSATLQAASVVVLSSLAAGVGAISLGASNFLMAPLIIVSQLVCLGVHNLFYWCKTFSRTHNKSRSR